MDIEEKAYTEHRFRRISSSKEQGFFRRRHMVAGAPIWRRGVNVTVPSLVVRGLRVQARDAKHASPNQG
jgi:hypothetical protein